jgi:hypothetical protein
MITPSAIVMTLAVIFGVWGMIEVFKDLKE